ncbi:MAG: GAF domain-containing protein [Spirochaetes bacterium]|nr:GAF domain-containing protein [Spirochaetota bacterium]
MNRMKIGYVTVFVIIILLVIYHLLLSFNIAAYFLSGQDIIVILILMLSVFFFFLLSSINSFLGTIPSLKENISLRLNTEEEVKDFPEGEKNEEKDLCRWFLSIQNYFTEVNGFRELMDKLLVASSKITRSGRASVMLYNRKKNGLYVFRTMGWDNSEIRLISKISIMPGEGIAGRVFIDGNPVIMNKKFEMKDTGTGYKAKYKSSPYVSFPIFSGKTAIGVLNLTEKRDGNYSRHEIDMVKFITTEVSIHLINIMQSAKENLLS